MFNLSLSRWPHLAYLYKVHSLISEITKSGMKNHLHKQGTYICNKIDVVLRNASRLFPRMIVCPDGTLTMLLVSLSPISLTYT